jgi:sn-glycerol 3-phosphate transport system substrate-binding protein
MERRKSMTVRWMLTAVLLAALLAACGGGEEGKGGVTPTVSGPVAIDFWHTMTASNQDTLKSLVDRFNSSQNEVRVNLVYQGTPDECLTKVLATLGTGNVPAVVQLLDIHTRLMVDSGEITPVQNFIDREDYDLSDYEPRAVEYYALEGKLQSMPFNVSTNLLFYDKNAFRDAGLDPERPPATLDEVRQYSEKLFRRDDAGNVVRSGIALDIGPWYLESMLVMHGDLYADNENGREGRVTEVVFNQEPGKEFFRWWRDMIRDNLAINTGRNPNGIDNLLAVGAGRVAMTISSSSALRSVISVLESAEQPTIELGVAALPGLEGSIAGPPVGDSSLWIMKGRPEAEQEAAWKLIKYLMEPEQQAEWFAGTGFVTVRKSSYDLPAAKQAVEKYPVFLVPVEQLRRGPDTPATRGALIGPFPKVREALAVAIEQMILQSKDPDQALDDAAAEANQIIADYNRRLGE